MIKKATFIKLSAFLLRFQTFKIKYHVQSTAEIIQQLASSLDKQLLPEIPEVPILNNSQLVPQKNKQIIQSQVSISFNETLRSLIKEKPSYSSFRKHNLNIGMISVILDRIPTINELNIETKAIFLNNLLTYSRKTFGRSIIKAKESHIKQILEYMETKSQPDLLPGLIQNISYSFSPELYIDQVSKHLMQNAETMPTNQVANSIYGLAKIARKKVQDNSDPNSMAAIIKLTLYNSTQLTLISLVPILIQKEWKQSKELVETLIAYQKVELTDEQGIGIFLLNNINNLIKDEVFQDTDSQLIHTLSLYQANETKEKELIFYICKTIFDKFNLNIKQLSLTSMTLSLQAFSLIDDQLLTAPLVEQCQEIYCQKEAQANLQDLSMLIEVSFGLKVMNKNFSKLMTDHYEMLKMNVDINTINRIIPNMSDMINLKYLDKKFINMFLISVKILNEKGKINQRFVKQFMIETQKIENEEINKKFNKIEFLLTRK